MRKARAWRRAAAAAVASLMAAAAQAQTLGKEACDAADAERAQLLAGGVQETVKKGPGWAKANLPQQKIKEVARYIALQEDLLFKCGQAKLRTLPAGDGEDGGDSPGAAKEARAGAAETPGPPKRKPPERKAAAARAEAGPAAGDPAPAPKVAAKPRPKPKPKVDDAFRPPKPLVPPQTE